MIVIDTNVIFELWRIQPDANVLAWMDAQAIETLYLSAITVAELRFGIAAMPDGRRCSIFQRRLEAEVLPSFTDRILAFDLEPSQRYAQCMAKGQLKGRPISKADGYIAATAAAHGMSVATRDTHPFEAVGLEVIDPWHALP